MMKLKNIALTLSLLFSVNSLYAYENSCYLAGGTYNDGVCHFGGDLHSVSFDFPNNIDSTNDYEFRGPNNNNTPLFVPVADKESDQVTVSGMFSTNMLFSGGDYDRSTVFDYISTNGGSAIFNFIPELRILGGNGYDSPAIRYAAYGQGSQAYLDSSEYFELSGGTGEESSAIYSLAANGGEAVIIASGDSKNPSQFKEQAVSQQSKYKALRFSWAAQLIQRQRSNMYPKKAGIRISNFMVKTETIISEDQSLMRFILVPMVQEVS